MTQTTGCTKTATFTRGTVGLIDGVDVLGVLGGLAAVRPWVRMMPFAAECGMRPAAAVTDPMAPWGGVCAFAASDQVEAV